MTDIPIPKHVQRALNQIAHSRALLRQVEERMALQREIDKMLAAGMTAEAALQQLRDNPPFVDPNY